MHRPNAFATDYGTTLLLSAQQQAIVYHAHTSTVIAALAGTGKTTTLACCAVHALRQRADTRILVLAYTKSGVEAFKQRLRQLVHFLPATVHITTLERWCARHLRQQDAAVHFETDPIALRQHAHQALLHLEGQLQHRPDERISLPHEVNMPTFWAFQRGAKKSLLMQRVRDEGRDLADFCDEHNLDYTQARLFNAYERLRQDRCGDTAFYAEGDCTYALAQEEGHLHADYDMVLLDEMHDMDLASLTVLRRILRSTQVQFLGAGDFNQHIEAQAWSVFQDQMHQLDDFLPRATTSMPLTQSRRFGPQIAQAVNEWFGLEMSAPSTRRSHVWHTYYDSDEHCIAQLMQAQAALSSQAARTHTAAAPLTILLRHAHDAQPLQWAAHRAGKSMQLQGFAPLYQQREIALLLGLMYVHGMQAAHWKSDKCMLSTEILQAFIEGALYFGKGQIAAQPADADLPSMAAQMHANPQIMWRFVMNPQSLQGGQRNVAAFGNFLNLPQSLQANAQALLQQAHIDALYAATPLPPEESQRVRAQVRSFVQAIAGMSVPQVLQQVAAMAQRTVTTARKGLTYDFQILSIEQAKGQEFDNVALPFLEPGRFPAPCAKSHAFLERNRLYVAMTRAKQRLWLMEHSTRRAYPLQA